MHLVHFGKKLTVLQFTTFVNENIAIMLDSGIDIVVLLHGGVNLFQGQNSTPTGSTGVRGQKSILPQNVVKKRLGNGQQPRYRV